MASMDVIPVPILASGEPQKSLNSGPNAVLGSENEKFAEQSLELPITGSDSDVVLVDYEENDPENPLNWSSTRKWLIVSAVSWMGFVSVFSTMTITSTAPQILEEFHSHSSFDQTLLVTIWELGEGIGPFFIAPLSERFGRLPVFHVGNFLALCCLVATALSVNIPMVIAFRFLTGCCLSILTLGPAIVGDMFHMEHTGVTMALVMGTQMIADFISPVAGSYIAQDLVVILKRKAKRLQKESADAKQNRSKHQARVDAITIIESVMKPLHILILMLTTSYMTIKYALVSLILATITETMESMYPNVFSRGSIGLTFLSLAIGNTIALIFYSLTSDRCMIHLRKKKGESFEPESRLIHLLLAAIILPMGFLIYGWSLEFHVQYIVPLIVTTVAGFSMTLSTIPIETYVVDVYKIHAASAIGAGVIFRAFAGAFLPLIGPPLYQGIGYGWGNSVLALIAALFIPPLGMLMRYGNWFRSRERFGSSGR